MVTEAERKVDVNLESLIKGVRAALAKVPLQVFPEARLLQGLAII